MVRVVVQRARAGSVTVGGESIGKIGRGLVILVGIREGDTEAAVDRVADKVAGLRIWEDAGGKMNLDTLQVGGAALVISQFTLYADVKKGRRPSFTSAAGPDLGRKLYERFVQRMASQGYHVECGEFGAHMLVSIENDGPVTIAVDSDELMGTG